MSTDALVAVRDLHIGFGHAAAGADVVHGVSFALRRGGALAIVGESGSGKSVTSRSLVGLVGDDAHVRAAELSFDGTDLLQLDEREWRRLRGRRVGLVLQDALVSLDPVRTVGREIDDVLRRVTELPRAQRRARALELLAQVGIPEPERRIDQIPSQLSGGLRQRALIAVALAGDPELIIADEPTTALDATVQAQILALLKDLVRQGRALLLISHDLAVVADVADEVVVMRAGVVVESGATEAVLRSPQHPYTQALLKAVPSQATRGQRLSETTTAGAARLAADWAAPHEGSAPVVGAEGLARSFPARDGSALQAVTGVSFAIGRGQTLGIVGESGSGKSTTARLVLGVDRPDAGVVRVDGTDWGALRGRRLREARLRVQAIHQDPLSTFDPRYRVADILREALRARFGREPAARVRARATELLELVGLGGEHLERHPLQLSGGQRQRVAIARALAPRPDLIVCDEPVSALDVTVQAQVLDLLADLQQATGVAYLFISHDLGVVRHVADRVLVMKDGRVVEDGPTEQVFTAPASEITRQLIAAVPRLPVAP